MKKRGITTEDWPRWTPGGNETKRKRIECDWSCFTPVLRVHWALNVSDKGWHPAGTPANRHATHTLITPNNSLHCYLPFNSQLSVRSYSVAPRNPCVLFSFLRQACVRFHLLPRLALDREVKNLPKTRGIKAHWNVYDLQIILFRHLLSPLEHLSRFQKRDGCRLPNLTFIVYLFIKSINKRIWFLSWLLVSPHKSSCVY